VIASGNLTHNLRDFQIAWRRGGQTPAYVREFADWMANRLAARDFPALLDYRRQAPGGVQAHPTEEHLLPLYVALGAAGEPARIEAPPANQPGSNAFTQASTITCSPWMPMPFYRHDIDDLAIQFLTTAHPSK